MMWVLLVAAIAGCGSSPKSDTIRIALNWFPESEHGGFFTAGRERYYAADHHDVTLVAGGPGVPVIPRVASRGDGLRRRERRRRGGRARRRRTGGGAQWRPSTRARSA